MNNLIISYDLQQPGQNYPAVARAVKLLGDWAKLQQSVWYVTSSFDAFAARSILMKALDANDKLLVVDATNNAFAAIGVPHSLGRSMESVWELNSVPAH